MSGLKKIARRVRSGFLYLWKIIKINFFNTATIFIYHRVAEVRDDPHKLSVSPANFRAHISYIKNNYEVVSFSSLLDMMSQGKIKNRTAVITFDDGYADNLHNALPILQEFDAPATIFVATGKIGDPTPFYWEEKTTPQDRGRALTREELLELSSESLIEIGAHTITHPNLAKTDNQKQKEEIFGSKKALEDILGKSVVAFAYPFGSQDSFTKETVGVVKKAGFVGAVSSKKDRVYRFSNKYSLPRVNMRNHNLDEFKDILNQI